MALAGPGAMPPFELSGEWWMHRRPFLHFRARNVFSHGVYSRLAASFEEMIGDARRKHGAFGRSGAYDADIIGLSAETSQRFAPLLTAHWMANIASLLGLAQHRLVDAALHSSLPGSRTGWIHTDYCAAWFHQPAGLREGLNFPDRRACDYFIGKPKRADAAPREYARAAALIYYLGNAPWREGDGGETGLYASAKGAEVQYVAPLNNSLLLFACSPHSYHRFIGNVAHTRNSIIFWLHEGVAEATARCGAPPRRGATA